jgi:hypothetical protein
MTANRQVERLCEAVQVQVAQVLASIAYRSWAEGSQLRDGDVVVLNNSFLFREGIASTVKNADYLAVAVNNAGESSLPAFVVKSASRINLRFKRIAARSVCEVEQRTISDAVVTELARLGTIIFALVGAVGEDQPAEVELAGVPGINTIRFVPGQTLIALLEGEMLAINRLDDIDVVWRGVEASLNSAGTSGVEQLTVHFEDAFVNLREAAGRPILIDDVRSEMPSILSEVVVRVDEQVLAYKQALSLHLEHPDDSDALNETLRIAYNFADGAKSLITLVVGISDLKPLLFWLTVAAQSDLADRFAELPFALVGKAKPSLERYRTLIAGARNRAFHDVFAFGRPFNVRLGPDAIRDPELHLFREYSRKHGPALDFEDRQVVELLEGLTRVAERPVPMGFWDQNSSVMEGVAEVARSLRAGLVLAAPPRPFGPS